MNEPLDASTPRRARRPVMWWVGLGLVVLVGATARLWNLDWDRGQHLHPDERHWSFVLDGIAAPGSVGEYFDTGTSPLDPYTTVPSFVYGTLPLFTTKAAAAVLESGPASPLVTALDAIGVDLRDDDGALRFDDGYGANLVGRLLSALADSVTILLVGVLGRLLAGRVAGLFAAGCYAVAVLPVQQAHFLGPDGFGTMFWTAALLAAVLYVRLDRVSWILASGALVGAAMACRIQAVVLLVAVAVAVVLVAIERRTAWTAALGRLLAACALAAVVFRVAQPYAFDGWWLSDVWVDDLLRLRAFQAASDVPPNLQWVGRTPVVYPLGQFVAWGIGPAATAATLLGGWVLWRRRARVALVPAAAAFAMLALIAMSWTPTMRYLMPLVPIASAVAGVGLAHLLAAARAADGGRRRAVAVAVGALTATIVLWGAAFVNGVYGRDHSRIEATEWIAANLPAGSTVSVDAWDDALPLRLDGVPEYRFEELRPFDPDSADKIDDLVDRLGRIDLVVVSSQRARMSVERLPARYPSTLRYYEALADGSLGFDHVASFQNVPRLGPLRIETESAEEAFSVYDHPPVDLYRRTDRFSSENARRLLDPALASTALSPPLADGAANALLATPAERARITGGDTFDDTFSRDGLPAVALWVGGWLVLAAASIGPSARLLRRSPASAAAMSLVLGPLAVTVVVWSVVAWGITDLSSWLVRAVGGAFVLVGGAVGWHDRVSLRDRLRRDRGAWWTIGGVAATTFLALIALRLGNPDLWHPVRGGEKPMEFAFFTSVARSPIVPPADPWFAGGVLNYYYLGYFHLAVPARGLGIVPEVAFQLGLATVAACATAIAAAVGHDIAHLAGGRWRLGRSSARIAGCVSAAGLLLVGNLDAIRQVLDGSSAPFDWWRTSRVHAGTLDVTEFPAWAFLFGDLHPHLMGTWLTGLVVLLGVALVAEARPDASPVRRTSLLVVLGVVVGLVLMTHTWDLPAVVVLSSTAVIFARVRSRAYPTRRAVLTGIVVDLVVVGATAFVLTAPYRRRSMVFNDGIDRAPVTTDLVDQLVHLGVWWAVAATFATVLLVVHRPSVVRRRGDWRSVAGPVLIGLGAVAILTGVGLAVSWVAAVSLVLVGSLAVGIVAEFRSDRTDPAVVVTGALLVAGVGLAAVPEFVIIAPDIERLNTVFKLTFEAWHLVALAVGPALVLVAVRLRRRSVRVVAATSGLVALVAVLAFPVLAVRPRLADRVAPDIGPTLDGLAYLDGEWTVVAPDGTPIVPAEDRPLIDWLRHEVGGQPTIVEMVGQAYGWNARVSVYTGLPTVIGWPWHETQQRLGFSDTVERRYADVQRLYTDGDADFASFFLRAHRVEYVVIGTVELATATPDALAVIESLPGADVVFRDGERRIIWIDQAALGTIGP